MITAERMRVGTMDASTYDYYLTSHGIDPVRYDSYVHALGDLREKRLDAIFFDSCAGSVASIEERLGRKQYHTFHRGGSDHVV